VVDVTEHIKRFIFKVDQKDQRQVGLMIEVCGINPGAVRHYVADGVSYYEVAYIDDDVEYMVETLKPFLLLKDRVTLDLREPTTSE